LTCGNAQCSADRRCQSKFSDQHCATDYTEFFIIFGVVFGVICITGCTIASRYAEQRRTARGARGERQRIVAQPRKPVSPQEYFAMRSGTAPPRMSPLNADVVVEPALASSATPSAPSPPPNVVDIF
jgi:hypothetical protein